MHTPDVHPTVACAAAFHSSSDLSMPSWVACATEGSPEFQDETDDLVFYTIDFTSICYDPKRKTD